MCVSHASVLGRPARPFPRKTEVLERVLTSDKARKGSNAQSKVLVSDEDSDDKGKRLHGPGTSQYMIAWPSQQS